MRTTALVTAGLADPYAHAANPDWAEDVAWRRIVAVSVSTRTPFPSLWSKIHSRSPEAAKPQGACDGVETTAVRAPVSALNRVTVDPL